MKVVIPVAGLGTRLRPHTHSKPKPLVPVAGKPVLGHILDQLQTLPVEEIIFITGYRGDQIEQYVTANYDVPTRYVEQRELRGQAHAINLAADAIDQPVLIIFVDTIIKADLTTLPDTSSDGVMFVQEVEDPRRFGVAVLDSGYITRLVEKPKTPVSNLAVVGVYYLRDWQLLKRSLQEVIDRDVQTAGEYYLADALQIMIDHGARIEAHTVDVWEDCGTIDALLHTNQYLLDNGRADSGAVGQNVVVIPPVYVAPTARVEESVIGPYVSIGDGAVVRSAVVNDSIISDGATVSGTALTHSLIGSNAQIRSKLARINVGDDSELELD